MARIPQNFIDDLVARADIVELIDARVPLKKAGREFQACCPFHNEKTPSFTVSPQKQFYYCFGCGAHGTALGFLMEFDRLDFIDAVKELAQQMGVEVPVDDSPQARERRAEGESLYDILGAANDWYQKQLPTNTTAVDYLKKRGLTGETAKRFGIGYAPAGWDGVMKQLGSSETARGQLLTAGLLIEKADDRERVYDRFRDRIIFPIRDARGRVIGFGGRVMGDDTPKYLNSPETPVFHKGRELYGLYEAKQANRELTRLLVVEGYMDVIALAEQGLNFAVATLGTAVTPDHLQRLFRTVPEVVFCFDGDRAGRKAAWRALEESLPQLRDGRQARFLFLPDGEDPDSLVQAEGPEAFEQRVQNADSLSRFLFDSLADKVDLSSLDGRSRLIELAKPLLKPVPAGAFRELLLQELAQRSQLDINRLERLLQTQTQSRPTKAKTKPTDADSGKPTAMRTALALLIQQPNLAARIGESHELGQLDAPGMDLFVQVLMVLHDQPQLNTAALLERWRDSEQFALLMRLARLEIPGEPVDYAKMFDDALASFDRRLRSQNVGGALNEQRRASEMSDTDKARLRELLRRN